ncbi:HAMP domain-containing sensor histidine kinase [Spirillospora sp. CA-142024]|uniref:HAMP domain-containing sensor histidine kinase n=1 Tax=Spirillospora sp. CA-142024 TaxID=3240036 RepID=UPI003D917E89
MRIRRRLAPRLRRLPVRLRLTLAFSLGMAAVLAALGAFLYTRLATDLLKATDLDLRARAGVTVTSLNMREHAPLDAGQRLIDPDESFGQILTPSGAVVETTPAVSGAPMLPPRSVRSVDGPTFSTRRVRGVDDPARLLAVPVQLPGPHHDRAVLVVGAPLGDRHEALTTLTLLLLTAGPVALVVTSCAGWLLAGAALRPVERLRREAAAITVSEPGRRLTVPETGDELTRLATTLNAMLARLQEALDREHRFVDAASHELRTPLALLKAELELAGSRPRDRDELAAAIQAAAAETDRLVGLAEDMLVLARTRQGRLPLRRSPVSPRRLLEEAAEAFRVRAEGAGTVIEVTAEETEVQADPVRLRQVLHNLLDNALRHSGPAGPGRITLAAARADEGLRVTVRDHGQGFPEAQLAQPPEPGRVGTGLGLSIVRTIIEGHGGTLRLENASTGGASVTLTMP